MDDEKTTEKVKKLFEDCSPVFIGLGDEQRQKLILDIAEAGTDGINVTSLAAKSHLSRPAVSHHLKVLKDCGLIVPLKKGTQIFYRLNLLEPMERVRKLMDEMDRTLAIKN